MNWWVNQIFVLYFSTADVGGFEGDDSQSIPSPLANGDVFEDVGTGENLKEDLVEDD